MAGMGTHLATERVRLVTPRLQLARPEFYPNRAQSVLAATAEDAVALNHWRAGYIATYALFEAVALSPTVYRIQVLARGPFLRRGSHPDSVFRPPRRPSHTMG